MNHTQSTQTGMNRTGIQMSPLDSATMQNMDPSLMGESGDESALVEMRNNYIAEADSLGSVPLPATLTGVVKTGLSMLTGENPQILLDKLGERLAFERTGTRLYDALITKCDVMLDGDISMTIDDLERIRSEEARHFMLVADAIVSLGGDPTSQTPSADMAGVESLGLVQVLNDPRTTIAQSLHAIVSAELLDRAGWETLIGLADEHDLADMAASFTEALDKEREHLAMVTTWYEEALGLTYGDVELDAPATAAGSTAASAGPSAASAGSTAASAGPAGSAASADLAGSAPAGGSPADAVPPV